MRTNWLECPRMQEETSHYCFCLTRGGSAQEMRSRFSKTFSMLIGLLLVIAVPTQAGPIKFVEVINVMGDLQGGGQLQQLRLRAASQDQTSKAQSPSTTVATNVTP